jgi:orotate phosphoribosyltransferase
VLSVADLRECDAVVENVLCVIDRESGGRENLVKEGLSFRALFTMSELKNGRMG